MSMDTGRRTGKEIYLWCSGVDDRILSMIISCSALHCGTLGRSAASRAPNLAHHPSTSAADEKVVTMAALGGLQNESSSKFVKVVELKDRVFQLTFTGLDPHRFTPDSIAEIHAALDEVENCPNAGALLTTNEGKFYSCGIDLNCMRDEFGARKAFVDQLHSLMKRVLLFPIPTVAAICGHAAGAGCIFALAQDYRCMRSDAGVIVMNEVDLGLIFTPGISGVMRSKLPSSTYLQFMLWGERFNGTQALDMGIVQGCHPDANSTFSAALHKATSLAKRNWMRDVCRHIKMEMFTETIKDLDAGLGFAKL